MVHVQPFKFSRVTQTEQKVSQVLSMKARDKLSVANICLYFHYKCKTNDMFKTTCNVNIVAYKFYSASVGKICPRRLS